MVRMGQSGFSEEQKANYRGAKYGWRKFLGGLETVLAGLGYLREVEACGCCRRGFGRWMPRPSDSEVLIPPIAHSQRFG